MHYHFDWDPDKAARNLRKHGISFYRATFVFKDPLMLSIFDTEHVDYEDRWVTMGHDESGIILVVVHTYLLIDEDHAEIRIISARKATKPERIYYGG